MVQPTSPSSLQAGGRPERADAVRNRRRILEAADRLFRERGVENVSMDEIAAQAGVGKGTLYRRFGDRSGLAFALLDAHVSDFLERVHEGPAPLGPGAAADERLRAFFRELVDHVGEHLDILLDSENAVVGARYRTHVYAAFKDHVQQLVAELRPDADSEVLSHLLLGGFAADLQRHLRREGGYEPKRLQDAAETLVGVVA